MLALQYFLGIYVNAYLVAPYPRGGIFTAHYAVGLLLVGLGLVILVVSALTRSIPAIATSAMALIFVTLAGQAGRLFAFYGQDPVYSVVMALGFLLAFASYFSELLVVRSMISRTSAQPSKTFNAP